MGIYTSFVSSVIKTMIFTNNWMTAVQGWVLVGWLIPKKNPSAKQLWGEEKTAKNTFDFQCHLWPFSARRHLLVWCFLANNPSKKKFANCRRRTRRNESIRKTPTPQPHHLNASYEKIDITQSKVIGISLSLQCRIIWVLWNSLEVVVAWLHI